MEYKEDKNGKLTPLRVDTVLISTQHDPDVSNEQIFKDIKKNVIEAVIPEKYLDDKTKSKLTRD